jgi:hypothetical protein
MRISARHIQTAETLHRGPMQCVARAELIVKHGRVHNREVFSRYVQYGQMGQRTELIQQAGHCWRKFGQMANFIGAKLIERRTAVRSLINASSRR